MCSVILLTLPSSCLSTLEVVGVGVDAFPVATTLRATSSSCQLPLYHHRLPFPPMPNCFKLPRNTRPHSLTTIPARRIFSELHGQRASLFELVTSKRGLVSSCSRSPNFKSYFELTLGLAGALILVRPCSKAIRYDLPLIGTNRLDVGDSIKKLCEILLRIVRRTHPGRVSDLPRNSPRVHIRITISERWNGRERC